MPGIVVERRDLDKSLACTPEYRGLARATQKQQAGSRGRRDGAPSKAAGPDGNGQPSAAQVAASPVPGGFDEAVDAFVRKSRAEFVVPPPGASAPKGIYHPTPTNLPVRWLCIGLLCGAIAGALVALALRR